MMGETIFPSAFLSYMLDANGHQTVEAAAHDQHDEQILLATDDAAVTLLSPREKLILRCIIEGDSNKSIARKIDIAEATVKVHVKAILRKTRVQNRTQAAIWGMNNGSHIQLDLVAPEEHFSIHTPFSLGSSSGCPTTIHQPPRSSLQLTMHPLAKRR